MARHTNTSQQYDSGAQRDANVDVQVQRTIEALEEDIVLGYLYPRERLIEDDLRARFNLKRHVVRQVLKGLEQMGLVERKKNIGALVRSYTEEEVRDLYQTREILETSCASLIPTPVSSETLDELKRIQRTHDEAVKLTDLKAVFRSNLVLCFINRVIYLMPSLILHAQPWQGLHQQTWSSETAWRCRHYEHR
ncbi:GntR family transcriptional regulator [Alcaligenaceae bacterium CGII-47]|nr:GntR family transcriptional regulator [Alcaligenaceae bacterium CGII-47]